MIKTNLQKILITLLFIPLLGSSCKKKADNFDIDLSNFQPKNNVEKISTLNNPVPESKENKIIENKLKKYKQKSEVLSSVTFGKKDPFSEEEININKLSLNFELTGFLNTENEKYVFVSYLDNEGTINEESIGGVNTNLLPNGAKVINIDPKNMRLTIFFENENFIFEL